MRALLVLLLAFAIPAATAQIPAAQPKLANPASQNCVDKGGKLTIEKNGKAGPIRRLHVPRQPAVRGMGHDARRMQAPAASRSRAT